MGSAYGSCKVLWPRREVSGTQKATAMLGLGGLSGWLTAWPQCLEAAPCPPAPVQLQSLLLWKLFWQELALQLSSSEEAAGSRGLRSHVAGSHVILEVSSDVGVSTVLQPPGPGKLSWPGRTLA